MVGDLAAVNALEQHIELQLQHELPGAHAIPVQQPIGHGRQQRLCLALALLKDLRHQLAPGLLVALAGARLDVLLHHL